MDDGCICRGNWRSIVAESEPFLGKQFSDQHGNAYIFFGVVHGLDDYYYGMCDVADGATLLLSCVGDLASHGFKQSDTNS